MSEQAREAADRVIEFAEELEGSGDVSLAGDTLEQARAALHRWVDEMTGVVVTPAFGRVTLFHGATQSSIASPSLPFAMSAPVRAVEG